MTSLPPIILLSFTYIGSFGESPTVAFFSWLVELRRMRMSDINIQKNLKKKRILLGIQICKTLKEENDVTYCDFFLRVKNWKKTLVLHMWYKF